MAVDEIDSQEQPDTQHHYVLAHYGLPSVARQDPYSFFEIMGSQQRDQFLTESWEKLCKAGAGHGQPWFGIDDLEVVTTRVANFPTVLFVFPAPRRVTEVFASAAVLEVPLDRLVNVATEWEGNP